ncbi:1-deoxy-D-xylulose 5-phosphate synthase family protein [Hibiscus syriacus]|uniref:1-deoxy-D-xylulose 5-phosphate synthase family protein n=1 Tax=Hibiscus syriacus TaxID=106335 RepID=A0A6A3D0D7_HIBSY|nr:1-deoxy-D-xylulose 5-phosphate synthase family protein [Hibiscus syriacus]
MNQYHIYEAIGRGKYSVRILHSLNDLNILKFYSWYETSAHLWLVLEFCTGGDLMTLLQQDGKLPEDSIHFLAYDLVKALQYLHSKGIIYCDLKPSNILLDENGHIKLCDFALARKLTDISKTPSSMLPQAKRGTPCYMAPELFEDGGVHSYASDFWALGCVLYECYAGKPPFVGREFTQLVKCILSDPPPPLPGSPSPSFVNIVNSLLIKDPAERIKWSELCVHAFWRTKFSQVPLPPQPAFDSMIESYAKPCLSERNVDRASQSKTPPKIREKDSKGASRKDENSLVGSRAQETPVKGTPVGRKTQTKASGRGVEEKHKRVNLMRLSRIAKTNLLKENEKENYRRPVPNSFENEAEVKIENTDMELDFDENTEEEVHDEPDGSGVPTCTNEEKISRQNQQQLKVEEGDNNIERLAIQAGSDFPASDQSKTYDQESSSDHVEVAATPPSVSSQHRNQRIKEGPGAALESDWSKTSNNISQVLWHPSDLSVRPVMPSRKADKMSELDALNNRIIAVLGGSTGIGEKQSVIRYLEMLSNNADAANILTNGPIMLMLVKMLRQSKTSALRVQLASLIGLLIRHSTFIKEDLANSGILGALTDGLRDRQEKVRRFSMAALGELLFYISTQNEQARDNSPFESPSKDNKPVSGWQVPNSLISLVSSVLRKGEDAITQLYALRTIENICSQGGYWAARFTSQDVISNLCYIYKASGKQESMRLTAGSCLVRLVRFNPHIIQSITDKLPLKDIASALVKGSLREQQINLNLLNVVMLGSHSFSNIGKYLQQLAEDKNMVPNLVSLIEQGSEILRGKALVSVALLCKNGKRWLLQFFCNSRLLPTVDRLAKEKDNYLQQCLNSFLNEVASTVPTLLDGITGDIQQMMGGRRHGQITALISRTAPKNNIHLFPVVLHLLESSSFKNRLVTHQVLRQLANLIQVIETPFQGRDDFQITLLRVLESIPEESPVILESSNIFIQGILPSLAVLYKGNKDGNARFLCLKIMFDLMMIFLNEPSLTDLSSKDLRLVSNSHFLPLYPLLIEDEDPIPMYAQKLLVMLIEFDYIKIPDILDPKMVSKCFGFLLGDLTNANVNNVKLCLALASAPEMDSKLLSELKVVRKIGNLLEFVNAKDMEDFLEPTLGLFKAFLLRSIGNGFVYTKEPALLLDGSLQSRGCISDIMDFGSNVGVLLELSAYPEPHIADVASECVVLLLKAAPREATTGFLTNLSKASSILESWRGNGNSHLLLKRLLHAVGFSCRQYLSQAMILSISGPEITRIQGIVSELKSSNIHGLANVASLVLSELQRLPRCV